MKKSLVVIFILGSIFFGSCICSFAAEGNTLVGSDEADEILEDMNIILEDVESEGITQEDIELNMDKIIRDYVDIDIFKYNIKTADEMRSYLENVTYLYLLPIYKGEDGYTLMISKGPEIREESYLTNDEIAHLEKRIGRWGSPGIGVLEEGQKEEDFDNKLKTEIFLSCYGINNSETFFVGGQTTNSIITAICFTEENEKKDDGPYYVALDRIDPNAKTKEEIEDAVFTYDEIKEYAWSDSLGGGVGGASPGSTDAWIIILIAAVVAAAAVVVIVVRKRKQYR